MSDSVMISRRLGMAFPCSKRDIFDGIDVE